MSLSERQIRKGTIMARRISIKAFQFRSDAGGVYFHHSRRRHSLIEARVHLSCLSFFKSAMESKPRLTHRGRKKVTKGYCEISVNGRQG